MIDSLPSVIAHRGASHYAPENTVSAFKKAQALGCKWVEFDVKLTADNHLVVIHDEKLKRTTNGRGCVRDHDCHTLTALDAGSWFGATFEHEKIPTLAQVFTLLGELNLGANIELKPNPSEAELLTHATLALLENAWPTHLPLPILSSFDTACLLAAKKANIPKGLLLDSWVKGWEAQAHQYACQTIHINAALATIERVQAMKAAGFQVLCYTVNSVKKAQQLFKMGVDSVFSDVPDKILACI